MAYCLHRAYTQYRQSESLVQQDIERARKQRSGYKTLTMLVLSLSLLVAMLYFGT